MYDWSTHRIKLGQGNLVAGLEGLCITSCLCNCLAGGSDDWTWVDKQLIGLIVGTIGLLGMLQSALAQRLIVPGPSMLTS